MKSFRQTLLPLIILLSIVIAIGTLGYHLIEDWPWLDSIYMTAITLTTVGFGEIKPLSNEGRIFTIGLIFLGVGTIAYGLSSIGEYLLSTDVGPLLRYRRNKRMIEQLTGHVIVCGYGRVGKSAVETILEQRKDLVIIEKDPQAITELRNEGLMAVQGDGTHDEVLLEAGIERASSIMICSGDDADNLFIVLSARTLNPNLTIVTRSVDPENEQKMVRAGADRVVSPHTLSGRFMANVLVRPGVTDFFRLVTAEGDVELWLEELTIGVNSELDGKTVFETDIRRKTGITLVGLLRHNSGETLTPNETTRLEAGDVLIAIGTRDQLKQLQGMAENPRK